MFGFKYASLLAMISFIVLVGAAVPISAFSRKQERPPREARRWEGVFFLALEERTREVGLPKLETGGRISSGSSCKTGRPNREGPPFTYPKFDAYGDLSFTQEKKRLDYFAEELRSVADEPGYIIEYRRKGNRQRRLFRAKRAKDYLVRVKNINAERISIVDGGYLKEFRIELRVGPFPKHLGRQLQHHQYYRAVLCGAPPTNAAHVLLCKREKCGSNYLFHLLRL